MTTPERRIIEAVSDAVSEAYVKRYLTPPEYQSRHLYQDKVTQIQLHSYDSRGACECACGQPVSTWSQYAEHLAGVLFPNHR